jgi:hypothetical protein
MALLTDKELGEIQKRLATVNIRDEDLLCTYDNDVDALFDHIEMLTEKNVELRRKVEAVEQMQPFESLTHMITLAGSQDEEDESWWRWAYEQGLRHTSQRRGKTPWEALGVRET